MLIPVLLCIFSKSKKKCVNLVVVKILEYLFIENIVTNRCSKYRKTKNDSLLFDSIHCYTIVYSTATFDKLFEIKR